MKSTKITPPEGREVDKEKSTFEEIVYKEIEKDPYPNSINDVERRNFYISLEGKVEKSGVTINSDINDVSTKERAEAFLALMQLVELLDAYNKTDGVTIDWRDAKQKKHTVESRLNKITTAVSCTLQKVLAFGREETRDLFLKKHRDLIETAKELL